MTIHNNYPQAEFFFEATGVYSRRLQAFLVENGYAYHMLNPLVAKKRMDNGSRFRKNDRQDALGLAQSELLMEITPFKSRMENPIYRELADMSRYYDQLTEDIKREKNRLHRLLQLTFANFVHEFELNQNSVRAVLALFPHAAFVQRLDLNELEQQILKLGLSGIGNFRAHKLAVRLWKVAHITYPAVAETSDVVRQVRRTIARIQDLTQEREAEIELMATLGQELPEIELLQTIPGIVTNTAVRLIGELGDLRRFDTRGEVNSFIGLDLTLIESGDYRAQRRISKHGNPHARKLLYWTVINQISSAASPNHIRDVYEKRQSTAPRKKPLIVLCMDRLIKTILHLIKTNQPYSYELARSK